MLKMQEWVLNARLKKKMELEMGNEGETHTQHTQLKNSLSRTDDGNRP